MTTVVEDVPAVVEIENLIDSKVDGLSSDELRELARMLFRKADDLDLRWLNMADGRSRARRSSRGGDNNSQSRRG